MNISSKRWIFPVCFFFFLVLAFFRISLFTPIHFDGSFFIFSNLLTKTFANQLDFSRWGGHFLFELPTVIYSNYFGTSLKTAAYLYSFTVVILPLTLILISYLILPKDKKDHCYYSLCSYGLLLISALYFEVHEANIANGFIWILYAVLLRKTNNDSLIMRLFLSWICFILSITFSVLFLIAPAIIIYLYKTKNNSMFKDYTFYLLLILSAGNYLLALHHNQIMPGTTSNFLEAFTSIFYNHSALAVAIFLVLYFSTEFLGKYKNYIFFGLSFIFMFFLFFTNDTFLSWHLYSGRVLGILGMLMFFYWATVMNFRSDPFRTIIVVISALLISGFYLLRWNDFQNDLLLKSDRMSGVIQHHNFSESMPSYGHACTHWNSEMFSVLIQHLNNRPVNLIVARHPDSPRSFFDGMGPSTFIRQLRKRGVTFGSSFGPAK